MKDDLVYLKHISDAIEKIERYLLDISLELFLENDMVIDAVVRELEIIGEAASKISLKFKTQYHRIPWNEMIGMRNRLIHEYFGVNKKIVWDTCKVDLKDLKEQISSLL